MSGAGGRADAVRDFPRRNALTRTFSLGRPRRFAVGADRVLFVRAAGPEDPVHELWALDLADGRERRLVDPRQVLTDCNEDVPPEERARRERMREAGAGVVGHATDEALATAAFALAGQLLVTDVATGATRVLVPDGGVIDPRPDPSGQRVAYVRQRALWVVDVDAQAPPRRLVGEDDPDVSWGLAEFVAAEEMGRTRGHWWSPDGQHLAVARVDESQVPQWYLASLVDPAAPPTPIRYPAAGTTNADVSLHVLGLDGTRTEIVWDRETHPYLAEVVWSRHGPLTLVVQTRDQREVRFLTADPATGATEVRARQTSPVWVDLIPGSPAWLPDGRLVTVGVDGDDHVVLVDDEPLPIHGGDELRGVQVTSLVDVDESRVLVTADRDQHTLVVGVPLDGGPARRWSAADGVASAAAGHGHVVVSQSVPDRHGVEVTVHRADGTRLGIRSLAAEPPDLPARIRWSHVPPRSSGSVLILPDGDLDGPLPVLLDPYGGPHARRVVAAADAYLTSRWFAAQGMAVLITDGPGAPGRGVAWEQAIHHDFANPILDAQVEALHRAADANPGLLDLDRVGIRGWSFGGKLAAMAVLRRPDVFHAAIAGAPVTNQRLYDTHYTERYLGHPDEDPRPYEISSPLTYAADLERPLLLIHGLADDNVVVAHTLQLSRALLEAGRPHEVLPLSGITHMTPQAEVAQNLLRHQLAFLRRHLRF